MLTVIKASISYFVVVLAFGFLLGTIRQLLLLPHLGETVAVLVELPFMVAISWVICSWCIGYFRVPEHFFKRLAMGTLAFCLLLGAEFAFASSMLNQTLEQFLTKFRTLPGSMGLMGQGLFGLFPILQVNIMKTRLKTH